MRRCIRSPAICALARQPADDPGNYRVNIDLGEHSTQDTLVHVAKLGNYHLLVGRDNKLFAPLERRFWYGLTAAIAVLSIAGLLSGSSRAAR
jgi:hypothetical protein